MNKPFLYLQFILLLFVIFVSCKSTDKSKFIDYTGFGTKEIVLKTNDTSNHLKDTLCVLAIRVPLKMDTFYHWIDFSDYRGGQFVYYRFADSNYSIYRDVSGFRFATEKLPDSLYQLSIRYKPFKEIPDSIMKEVIIDTNELGYKMPNAKFFEGWIKREKRRINGIDFIITAYHDETWLKNLPYKIIIKACTYIDNRMLEIIGECDAKDTTGFIDNMYKSFLSIKITKKQ